ncbi:hypothetical protein AVEN_60870-1 [Araneus ventricosus]|uniref:Uncharacterized protein n=1 Tax=Araneus ventricosus TaxID=182803 RepID=A0A4Y2RYJ6_ARAVE|nr:hypothetical protein AVEN_60870-1 [Araneus ventricosus]
MQGQFWNKVIPHQRAIHTCNGVVQWCSLGGNEAPTSPCQMSGESELQTKPGLVGETSLNHCCGVYSTCSVQANRRRQWCCGGTHQTSLRAYGMPKRLAAMLP